MDRDRVEVHELAKEGEANIQPSLTEQAWSIKDLLLGLQGNFSYGTQRVIPSGQDSAISSAWVANHSPGFGSTCPLMDKCYSTCQA